MNFTFYFLIGMNVIILISYVYHRGQIEYSKLRHQEENCTKMLRHEEMAMSMPSTLQQNVSEIFNKIDKMVPSVTFTHIDNTTSAKNSRATLLNPKNVYCIGDNLTVQLDMYDYLGNRKKYGGDFFRPRIYSPELQAAASGRVEDLNNGTYLVHFTLFWQGRVKFSLMVYHPSEGISALWRARHASDGVISFQGKFQYGSQEAITKCGFRLDEPDDKLCKYLDHRDEESIHCIKIPNLPCESLTYMRGVNHNPTYLTALEKQLFVRSNIAVEISKNFEYVDVGNCTNSKEVNKEKCRTGMDSPFPSGYFMKNEWHPVFCNMFPYITSDQINSCLQGKKLYLIGDSTLRQFIMYFTGVINNMKYFNHPYGGFSYWEKTLLALNMEKSTYVHYKRHGFPLESFNFYYFMEDAYTSRQIDQHAGGKNTIIAITMGQHFRQFPLHLYIRRAVNIRRAIERLFLRSPDTKVIIKTENTRDINTHVERLGEFHGYTQYLVMKEVFRGLNVGFIDVWDMSNGFATEDVHPQLHVLKNIISLAFTYAC
ncbi:NXPE family member 1 [Microcaecilia unicolor]|uniref:NXPE family member 1-like n=1 Tax=Microcaecilia unicolor TaxID=1415580 RepID=A0A6P7ZJS2_9AMPH|nr:NXPE family member 1-like [Microcaecilia unicolor]XP_030077728.1 NXPE family member 1-like [Microcaecilia unicolor]XP_030077729.1 NXPE family member 1-like [Microcaecilia unicolor]XP_030077731.1 NXPE family member 1-like [Microcaecilia unicolor]XP_030077732.1 NXPE family member 1-like [Microcaecilia unicolor]